MASNPNVRRLSERPAVAGLSAVRSRVALAAAALLAAGTAAGLVELATLQGRSHAVQHRTPAFVAKELGPARPHASLVRTPAPGLRTVIDAAGVAVVGRESRIAVRDVWNGGRWSRHRNGASRRTSFGTESVVVTRKRTEQFVTVDRHLAAHTWRWQLRAGRLVPRLGGDGAVAFLAQGHILTPWTIAPVRILDADGRDVTPKGARWQVHGSTLVLTLDDSRLPVPYVIDPAITQRNTATATNGGATSINIATPAGLALNDLMVAQISMRNGGAGTFVCPPAGWTSVDRANSGTSFGQEIFDKVATAADVSNGSGYTFTFGSNSTCTSTVSIPVAGGIAAFYGVNDASPISAHAGQGNSSTSITAPTITPGSGDLILGFFGIGTGTSITAPGGYTEQWQNDVTTGASGNRIASEFSSALSNGTATGAISATASSSAANVGQQVSLALDSIAPTNVVSATSVAPAGIAYVDNTGLKIYYKGNQAGGGSFQLTNALTDSGSGPASSAFPALGGTTTGWSYTPGTQPISTPAGGPYVTTGTFTYSANTSSSPTEAITATDNAGNTSAKTYTFTNDQTAPTATVTFPANGGFYNAAGWNTISGTASDAGSGVAATKISIQDTTAGGSSCWNGSTFTAACPNWVATAGSPTAWTYALAAGSMTTNHNYTATIQTTDNVTNSSNSAATVSWMYDTTAPSVTGYAIQSASTYSNAYGTWPVAYYSGSGTNIYYNGSAGSGAQTFKIRATVTDTGGSGPASLTSSGFANGGSNMTHTDAVTTTPGAGTYDTNVYSFTPSTSGTASTTLKATDAAGNASSSTGFSLVNDTSGPTGGALTVNGTAASGAGTTSYLTSGTSVTINSRTDYNADSAGVSSSTLTYQTATLGPNDACGAFGSSTTVAGGTTTVAVADATCYLFTLTGVDVLGNASTITTTVHVDKTAPSDPTYALSEPVSDSWEYESGSTLYFNPGASGSHTFRVTASTADGQTGIKDVTFSAPSGLACSGSCAVATTSPYTQDYTWTSSTTSAANALVGVAHNNAGTASNQTGITLTSDSTAPTNTITFPTGASPHYNTSGWGNITGTTSDSGSGMGTALVSIQDTTVGGSSCWNGSTAFNQPCPNYLATSGTPASWSYALGSGNLTDGHSYTITAQATDNVNNSSTTTQSFVWDASPATMSSATVAADGVTVTVTWSENLDTSRAVPGSTFSVSPNGGAGIAGTASAVMYPAANQTRFTLSSAVHHLDSLALTYTKPASDPMIRDAALTTGNASVTATLGNASITNSTSDAAPSTPALATPSNAAQLNTTTPTLTATFSDPDTNDTGKVTFQVCADSVCTSSLGTFDSSSTTLANGTNGSGSVPAGFGLANGTTYYWRAKNVDSSSTASAYSATRSFTVDTQAPTMSSATVAADGTTVTVTWSENVDSGMSVNANAFSVSPNGGASIVGSGTVTYPAANQTRFTLSSAVHHLDSLALTYTKPGSAPWVRDTATDSGGNPAGNAAATGTLNNASITNNTSNAAPNAPALVSPGNAAQLNTTTPTLTATFGDPDTQDTGKVTFQVCSDSACSSPLGTFDSSSTTLAVGANGSAAVPGGLGLANGTTYYWRAKDVDSSSASSAYTATRSFTVDTQAPTMSSATVAADGVTVTITWSENLDQTQTAGLASAFSVSPNGGAGIAGTGAVSYPAANQTRFTLASAVHHLDSLALTYTKPGSTPWVRDTATPAGNPAATATLTNASITNNTTDAAPSTPALVSPANAAQLNSTTPTLTATFSDPDTQDTGKVTFQVCSDSGCTSPLGSFDSTSTTLAVGANGSAAVPAGFGLTNGTTYYWRAKNTDSSSSASAYSATRSFTVDTQPPTMSSATVAADGVTVTITWSENLDQTQAVAGSAFAVSPNGGASIAGSASAVSYPAANQTRFTLSSAVHHLDTLAITYTKPGSTPWVRDTATDSSGNPAGNPAATATLTNASITNSTTDAAPTTPTLVSPANAAQLNTSTPTLTATFSDPDTNDTGKVTFQVCSDSGCTSPLGTFDSTSTTLAVGANGSASVPGGFALANGSTYYWRAKNVDSSSTASAYSATRSFTVDTQPPTMSSATVAADGVTVTVTWSENLDQSQAVAGSAFSVSPNGGASIAGSGTVTYPAANQTRFTLASAVHHLDTLAITYTKPGSTPWVRDTATPTGNPAATATLTNASITNSTTDAAPSTPALVSPANAAQLNTATPTLTATFSDPDTQDTGKVTFQVCSDSGCTSPLGSFDSTSTTLAVGANGSGSVPAGFGLTNGTTYYWRAKNTDSSSSASAYSATRSFTVDTQPPTMSSATVAADGVTVTITWSENLDQTQAVPGSAFAVSPNGGASIAGTASAVSYPAANQTRFTLSSAVHHLDTLAITYTKPGSTPWVRDTATDSSGNPAGNPAATATLTNASITNSTTDAAPNTPALVTPAAGLQLNSATPALTATFSDPDPNDTGTVTFQVCGNATCTAGGDPIATFSTGSGIANNTNGTASVPGAANLTDGTYYWRAKNVDSASTSSAYSATRAFVVDTTPPTMSSATVGADGTTVTVTWNENLDQTQATGLGAAFSVAPNGGAAIAGTGDVSYPASNQTRFTLATAVHYLDTLSLSYTAPSSGAKVRDAAAPTGNAAGNGSLANASITNNTASAAPSTPALVSPASGAQLNTATPTLTATFSDPDTNDTGKITFQVCADSSCASVLQTFNSSSSSIANGSNGSGSPTSLADGTYYWRAKNVDSTSLASSYNATRSFVVDRTPPTMTSATIDPDGLTVTVTWSENLDTSQAVAGSDFSISRNGGAGIAGTAAAVTYAAPNQTRFTLSGAVQHLDNLSLTYTQPGSGAAIRDTAVPTGNAAATATLGNVSISNNTGNQSPNLPTLVTPSDGAQLGTSEPTLTATFSDPDTNDTGTLTFQVCANATCTGAGDPLQTFSTAAGIANNTSGSASVPTGLPDGTYYWRAKGTDSSNASSSYTATRSFVVATTPPTVSSASVAADGQTVTVTWSENLDQTQAVAGSAFAVNGIAGTGSVSYPTADQTQFTLASPVHHLDTLTLAYTQPGANPMIRDTAVPTGNPAASASGIAVTNNTADAAPTTPVLVGPGNGAQLANATPTLSATFADPDPNDSGKVTFQVCADSSCASVLQTFDSSTTSIANGGNGSAAVPSQLADGSYHWRAKNVDSSSNSSSYSATRSFTVDTTAPTVSSASVAADGQTVTVTWSENLDQTQAVAGSAFAVNGIAGTGSVSYPTADQTQFTLASPVHHLDTLTLAYTQPGANPMIRDTATPTGNPAASASGIAVTNNTADAAPTAPVPVDPADGLRVDSARPALTATFTDPDPNDTGTITFQVCADASCSTVLQTFSTSAGIPNGSNGTAAVPSSLADGTYHWRAKAADSASQASAYGATRSFVVDTTAPTIASAAVAADGQTVTVSWSEPLDQSQAVAGSAFSVNGIAGTGTISYASATQTTFTLAAAVHHLDTLTLAYTQPGANPMIRDTATPTGNPAASASGVPVTNNTTDAAPSTPVLVSPAGGAQLNTATPTLSATFADPDPNDHGVVRFQLCTDSGCASPIGSTFDSPDTANGALGSATVPSSLADGTYYWRAKNLDSSSNASSYSATRAFTVDTTAPTIASAAVAADGQTVTVSWSEPLDQSQAVAGSAFSVNGIAGTGTVSYSGAGTQTTFTIAAAVYHLDTLTLAYTKPGANPIIRDTATPTGNPAASANSVPVTNNTTDAAPSTPALVSPAGGAELNTVTPTLTATFVDPDPNDVGKVTFQVCAVATCATQLGTFDSTSSSVANGENGSAAIPFGTITTDGTYYWRAENVDSASSTSSYSSTRSFVVDTTAPTIASAAVAADGQTVTVSWSEPLDQSQAVAGSAFSVNGIAGTGTISYASATQTTFTLAAAVHHLDTLTLAYTQPGANPMIRDTATPTGNPAASASGVPVTNNTTDAAPSTPVLVSPAGGAQLNTATPTLSATFADPDPNDHGVVRFQLCTDSGCASPIGSTFDSPDTANGALGSATVPSSLADGTYYWRAKNLDSSSNASSYSATRAFTVDTTAPTIASAAVAADGQTVTVSWSEPLDQSQAVAGSAFSVNGIAGTGTVSYSGAGTQTTFTIAAAVYHLDTLTLAYTKPGANPIIRDTATPTGNPAASASSVPVTNNTANAAPSTPTPVNPADGLRVASPTPALTATFIDPDPSDTGTLTFEICGNATCTAAGDPLQTFSTGSGIANNSNGTASVPTALADGTYDWRARGTDSSSSTSSWSAARSLIVDTTAPTIGSASVAADGTTVTVTWSESLDTLQNVPGSAFSVNGIAGTGTVAYPSANETRFALASPVHHLDTLTLSYTQPGSGAVVRDTASPTGNAAASASGVAVTNNTADAAPNAPALVSPADAAQLNTATPTLRATFSDPDPNDSGKVTFQVCAVSNCATQLQTFDSTSTTIANGANGSAAVPTALADGTYYWRAENVDSASTASSYSAIRSLTVDTTPATMTGATIAPDGRTVTVTWSESLDQTQAVPGSAFSVTPNGGSAIAGTAAVVSYPAPNQTQFTLAAAVHHLDVLSLAYAQPGGNPMIRDLAQPTGNATATETLGNASITNSTANIAPSTPTLVDPPDTSTVGSYTPQLTATFADPDTQDTGKVTFQVCNDAACTSPLGTFDSTNTSLANGQQGTGAVPAGFGLTEGGTYYWRAMSTDSSNATSAWSSTFSFTAVTDTPPNVPTLVSPADGAYSTSATPSLTANFTDPDAGDTGRLDFRVCASSTCTAAGDPVAAFSSPSGVANGANGSATAPTLADGTYFWSARSTDSFNVHSAYTASRKLIVDTTPPTIASAAVGADGRTVTVTWSEPLDQGQTVAGSAFSVNGIAGTGTVTYPAGGTQTRFVLASAVHHLDALTLAYTRPGSDPMIHDVATNAAASASGIAVTNNTADAAPATPTLVSPADGTRVDTRTPTLTATFADPDPNDSGKVTFEICADSACSSILGTFDSTSTTLANGANGSAAVPAGAITADGTYYWRAQNVDSSSATSAFGATRSVVVDTTAPTISSASVAADGTSVTVTWSEPLDAGQSVAGSAFSINGIAGTGTVGYSGSQTTFSLATGVHHDDVLSLDYTPPAGAQIRDRATPTGNAATAASGISVTNNTADVPPATPALVSPAGGVFVNTTTPTLTATFSDPDPNDTGTVTFEICSTSACGASSLGTFTSSSVANGANASAAVPAAFGLQDGSTYDWRAKSTDSAAGVSGFSGTRSFTVDTTPPALTMTPPTPAANQYYDAANAKLWLNASDTSTFELNATADDPQSGLAEVRFGAALGNAATDVASAPFHATYSYDPADDSGTATITAFNTTVGGGSNSTSASLTIAADGTPPAAFSLASPAAGTIGTGITVSAAPTDAQSGLRQVSFFYCDLSGGPCAPSIQIGLTQTTPVAGIYSVTFDTTGLTDGHQYALDAVATDNVGHTTTSAYTTVTVDNSAPTIAVAAPVAVTGAADQSYDAANKRLWLNASGSGSFKLRANASDPDSGIASVTFPALLGTGSNSGTLNGGTYESSTYSFSSPAAPGSKTITAANGVTNPAALTASDAIDVEVDGAPPTTIVSFPVNNGSYQSGTWNPGCAAAGICGTVTDAGSGVSNVFVSIKDETTGKYWGGSAFDQSSQTFDTASVAGSNWHYPLDESQLTAPHVYLVEVYSVDNVSNADVHQQFRFTYGSDVGGPTDTLSLSSATHAFMSPTAPYVLYYGTANGAGGFTLHASATDPSGVDSVTFPDLSGTSGFGGSGGTSTNGSSADPYVATSSYTFSGSATTAPGAANVDSADLRGNVSHDQVTFVLDNSAPTGGALAINGGKTYSTSTTFPVGHTDYTSDGSGSGVASSVLTIQSAPLANGVCGSFGSASAAVDGPFTGTDATCYRFTLTGTDNVGNVATVSFDVKVDTTPPSQPTVGFSNLSAGNTFDNGSGTLYYRPSAGGGFHVDASAADAQSGIQGYSFSPLTGFAGTSQSGSSLHVSFDGSSTGGGAFTVHATNNAGLDSTDASYDVTPDSTPPSGGSLTVNGTLASGAGTSSYLTSGSSVSVATTPYTDGGSGMASQAVTVQQATLANDVCGAYGGSTTVGGSSYGVSNGSCYRFTLTATDNVGNVTTVQTTVKVDTTAPLAPTVSFSGTSAGNTFVNGTTLYYRPSAGGTFTVNANGASDPETGIAGYTFASLGGFTSTTQSGNRVDVTFDGSSTGSGTFSVVANNRAGVSSTPATTFSVTKDAVAPTGGLLSVNAYSGSLTIPIATTNFTDAGSGIATNVVTRSDPQAPTAGVCPASGYSGSNAVTLPSDTVPSDGQCYRYTLTGTDNVGNTATYSTIVLVDTTGPTGGSIDYANGASALGAISVDWNAGSDPQSGIAQVSVERASAPVSGGSCGPLGGFSTIVANATTSPFVDSSVSAGNCYAYEIVVTNNAGVSSTFSSASVTRLTTAVPYQLASGNPAGAILEGSTVYLGPSAANRPWKLQLTAAGGNGVTQATWQGKGGPGLTSSPTSDSTPTNPPFDSGVYQWDGSPLNDTIQLTRDPGAQVDAVNVVSDLNPPSGSITYADGTYTSHSVHITTSASDAESGVAGTQVERAEAPLVGASCGTWTAYAPITLDGGGNDTSVVDNTCYRYELVVTDNVGNQATFTSANVAEIPDITPPTFVSAATNVAGTQLAITMSEPLDATATTPASAFTVTYDGVAQPTPSGITVSGPTVTLGLVNPPNDSQTVRVSYTQPSSSSDRMRDNASPTKNETASFGPVAVTNNTPDTVAPSVTSTSVDASTITIVLDEALAGAAPDPSAFAVTADGKSRAVSAVSMNGGTVTLTLASPVTSEDTVSVSYAVPALNALHDAAGNLTAAFTRTAANQTAIVLPPTSGGGVTAPAPALVATSPDDGSTVHSVATITLTANQSVSWTNMTVLRPDGSVAVLQEAAGATWVWPFSTSTPGLYVVHGTISAGGRSVDVLSHFTVWAPTGGAAPAPPVEKNAVPQAAGELVSPDGQTTLTWPSGAFGDEVVVDITPRAASEFPALPANAVVFDVSAFLRSTHARVTDVAGVVDIRFNSATAGSHVMSSPDGKTWSDLPQLPTLALPPDVAAGWFRDSDGAIHVLAEHLEYFALVGGRSSTDLALRIVTVRRLWLEHRSFIAVRLSITMPARVTGVFVAPDGTTVPGQVLKTPTRRAGVTILRVPLRIRMPGLYKLEIHAEGDGQVANRTAKIAFLAKRPASPIWQDGAIRVAVVRGAGALPSLERRLGSSFVVRRIGDAALYDVVDTSYRTAAAVVVVDLATVPTYTLAELHALLPEVQIIGIGSPARSAYDRSIGVTTLLPRGATAAQLAQAVRDAIR